MSTTSRLEDNIILDKSDLEVCEIRASIENISLGSQEKITASEIEKKPQPTSVDLNILLKEQLDLLHCPFTWDLKYISHFNVSRKEEKLEEIEEDGMFQWRTFILNLALCNENYWKCEYSKAFEHQRICEEIVKIDNSNSSYEIFYKLIKDALLHVTLACKCHLLFKTGIVEEARQILQIICGFEDMVSSCKAAIWGIRAAYAMEFGYEGTKSAIKYSEKALELDPKQSEWHFLLGKSLGRIRRIEAHNNIPEHRELKALETAVQLTEISSYIIYLAQTYREAAFRVFLHNRINLQEPQKSIIARMNQRSADLYKKALELRSDSTRINIRCAHGFSKLPYPYKNIQLAQECCNKGLILAPNNAMVHHVAGNIAEKYENDLEKAKKHYQIAGEQGAYGACIDLIKVKYKEDKSYNPIPDLKTLLNRYTEVPLKEETICQMGSFYFFIKNDLATAIREYWSKIIEQNPDSEKLKNHRCDFLIMKTPVNIYDCIFDGARLAIQNNTSREDLIFFRKIILDHTNKFPDSLNSPLKDRRQMAWDEATYQSRSRPRHGRGRGRVFRGRGRGRGRGNGQRAENQHWRREGSQGGKDKYQQGGKRSLSREGRGGSQNNRHTNQNYNRGLDSSKFSYGVRSRDSSINSRKQEESTHQAGVSIRNSSIDRRDSNHSRERNFGSSWHHRDSSSESRSSLDKNWRAGPRNFEEIGRYHRDSSDSSIDRRTDGNHGYNNHKHFYQRSRNNSTSSIESSSDVATSRTREYSHYDRSNRSDEQHTHRTRSTSSFGSPTNSPREWTASDTQRDQKDRYHGGGDRNRSGSESERRTDAFSSDFRRNWKEGCLGGGDKNRFTERKRTDSLNADTPRDWKEGYHGYSNKSRSSSEIGRKRADSLNADTRRDWKEGYHGYSNKSRSNSESGRQTHGPSKDTCRD